MSSSIWEGFGIRAGESLRSKKVLDCRDGRIRTETLYEFREEGMKDEKIEGSLVKDGEIQNREKLVAAGL